MKILNLINDLLSQTYFPRFKYQLSYLAKLIKKVNGEEDIFRRWIKSDILYNQLEPDTHSSLMQKLDDEQLEGSVFQK